MLQVERAPRGSTNILGFDTVAKINAPQATRLAGTGLHFAVRYVGLAGPSPGSLDALEVDLLTSSGLALMGVQYARTHDWSAETGRADGEAAARNALAAGLPPETTLWCDMEGAIPGVDVAIAYANAWYDGATSVGMNNPGVYVGAGLAPPLSDAELFHALPFQRYWRSFSAVSNVQARGYQMLQLYPGDQVIAGVQVDLDVVQSDYLGSRPCWAVARRAA
jgi:hypothetical protein